MANRWGNNGNSERLYFLGIQNHCRWWLQPLNYKTLALWKKSHRLSATAKSLQSCPTLCDPTDGSPPGSPTPGILQARTLEWVAISFSNAGRWKVKVKSLSRVWPSVTPWTAATRLLCPWDFPGKSTGVGCYCLLPQFLATQCLSKTVDNSSFLCPWDKCSQKAAFW